MSSSKSIVVTGGAGYVGSVLVDKLVNEKFNVKVIDSLVFGNDGISHFIDNNSIEFFNVDIRETNKIGEIIENSDCLIHLAAIVGEPLCKKIPNAAKQINEIATKNLVKLSKKYKVKQFIFASTCSNYGSSLEIVNETSPVQPLSLYSECKVNSEKFILWSLAIPILFFGFYPELLNNTIEISVNDLIENYNFNINMYTPEVK